MRVQGMGGSGFRCACDRAGTCARRIHREDRSNWTRYPSALLALIWAFLGFIREGGSQAVRGLPPGGQDMRFLTWSTITVKVCVNCNVREPRTSITSTQIGEPVTDPLGCENVGGATEGRSRFDTRIRVYPARRGDDEGLNGCASFTAITSMSFMAFA